MSTNDDTLDFLADLVHDGMHEIRRELFQQLDETLLRVLAVEFPTAQARELAEDDHRSGADDLEAVPAASRPGRLRPFTSTRVIHELRRLGFLRRKSTGGHRIFVHPAKRGGHVAVPHHRGDLPRGTLSNILRQATQVLGATLAMDPRRSRFVVLQQ